MSENHWTRGFCYVALIVLTLGCDADVVTTPETQNESDLRRVTRAVATALGNVSVREEVISAMRASPWTEHKLILQDYLRSDEGVEMLRYGSQALNLSESEFLQLTVQMPRLDFYVAFRSHRREWQGDGTAWVAGSVDQDHFYVYGSDGSYRTRRAYGFSASDASATFALHPEERKLYRISFRSDRTVGPTVEDPDAPGGGVGIGYRAPGEEFFIDIGRDGVSIDDALKEIRGKLSLTVRASETCDDPNAFECSGDGSGGFSNDGPYGTYIPGLQNLGVRDGVGDAEFQIKFWISDDQVHGDPDTIWWVEFGGVKPGDVLIDEGGCPQEEPFWYSSCISSEVTVWEGLVPEPDQTVLMEVWENDCCGGDDFFGAKNLSFSLGDHGLRFEHFNCEDLVGDPWCADLIVRFREN